MSDFTYWYGDRFFGDPFDDPEVEARYRNVQSIVGADDGELHHMFNEELRDLIVAAFRYGQQVGNVPPITTPTKEQPNQ